LLNKFFIFLNFSINKISFIASYNCKTGKKLTQMARIFQKRETLWLLQKATNINVTLTYYRLNAPLKVLLKKFFKVLTF